MRCRWTLLTPSGQTGLFQTFWRPGTSGGSTADATDIVARVRTMLVAAQPTYSIGCAYVPQLGVDVLEDSTGHLTGSFSAAPVASVTGTVAGDPMPPQTAYLVRHNTNLIVGGRRLRGRTYFGVPGESQSGGGGGPIGTFPTTLQTAFTGLITGGTTLSFPVIWARPVSTPVPRAGTSGPVTSSEVVTTFWGTQRNRRF
jgi:hypothetical protein